MNSHQNQEQKDNRTTLEVINDIDKLERYADKLSANKILIKGAGHFNPKSGITEIEELNKIILGE